MASWRNCGMVFAARSMLPTAPTVIEPPAGRLGVGDCAGRGASVPNAVARVSAGEVGIGIGAQAASNVIASAQRARSNLREDWGLLRCCAPRNDSFLFIHIAAQHVINRLASTDYARISIEHGDHGGSRDHVVIAR